ncbi:hypothetical protein BIV25_35385 [Streptomyces sp. MUSC 14]|uniref:NAD(P)/FAD-dependent oxidoreductase n=1 Tax=Streptomyces sp. MUSC 14 TaxID=1354889 RepID=UPI0008F5C77C|nr:NAD(P)/FAD-dependent oxidoreductase [Streptomyces sp. MUSC 14]OIJ88969.1 hypothetical protein BIV25_35385 [Streptomyces sp. MUSC 14]
MSTRVLALHGNQHLEHITLIDDTTGVETEEQARFVFTFIGARPRTGWLAGGVECDEHGFVPTSPDLLVAGKPPAAWPLARDPLLLETSVPGVFAAGDVRAHSIKRVASGVGEGAMAVALIHRYRASPGQ